MAFDPGIQELLGHWHGRAALFCYYSYAQMTMLGYSDMTPVCAPATTLSLFAALFGMFYTAVVVSQLVAWVRAPDGTLRQPMAVKNPNAGGVPWQKETGLRK